MRADLDRGPVGASGSDFPNQIELVSQEVFQRLFARAALWRRKVKSRWGGVWQPAPLAKGPSVGRLANSLWLGGAIGGILGALVLATSAAAEGSRSGTIAQPASSPPPFVSRKSFATLEELSGGCSAQPPGCPECWVECRGCDPRRRGGWEQARAQAWQAYAHGQYLAHARLPHVPEYRLRVDDQLELIYRLTREETSRPYRLNVGDEIRVESFTDPQLNRDLIIQPDGTITLRLLGQVRAKGLTVAQLRDMLEQAYTKYYKVPAITVTPLRVNTKLEDLRASVDRRYGAGGQGYFVRVSPEGTVSLPGIGPVQAQGLSLAELQREVNERYRQLVEGIEVIPVLVQRAARYIYVLGEVRNPGRFELTGPTTLMQAISMAGGWNIGANLRQVVVFRRTEDWRLMATMVNLEPALMGKKPCPAGEIWLADSDVVVLPKNAIQRLDDFIELVFTRGIYGVIPFQTSINFSKLNSL